jgi:hypothetical protein
MMAVPFSEKIRPITPSMAPPLSHFSTLHRNLLDLERSTLHVVENLIGHHQVSINS